MIKNKEHYILDKISCTRYGSLNMVGLRLVEKDKELYCISVYVHIWDKVRNNQITLKRKTVKRHIAVICKSVPHFFILTDLVEYFHRRHCFSDILDSWILHKIQFYNGSSVN